MSDFFRRHERMQFDQQNMLRAQRGEKIIPIPERLLDESEMEVQRRLKFMKEIKDNEKMRIWSVPADWLVEGVLKRHEVVFAHDLFSQPLPGRIYFKATEAAALEIAKEALCPLKEEREMLHNIGLQIWINETEGTRMPLPFREYKQESVVEKKRPRLSKLIDILTEDPEPWWWSLCFLFALAAFVLSLISITR